MTPMLQTVAPRTLIVSDNMIEAEDLSETLMVHGLGPVAHVRDLDEARSILADAADTLRLMMFGLSFDQTDTQDFLSGLGSAHPPLVVIDGPVDYSTRQGTGVLLRPFSTSDVVSALARLGLRG